MKRVATPGSEELPQKRVKTGGSGLVCHSADASTTIEDNSNDPFRPSLQRKATDVCENGADDDGFVKGSVVMRWNVIAGKLRFLLEVTENGNKLRFEVECSGPCPKHFEDAGLRLDVKDDVFLSLRGVTLKDKPHPSGRQLPKAFHYEQGIALKCVKNRTSPPTEIFLSSWAADSAEVQQQSQRNNQLPPTGDAPFGDDWFATPLAPVETNDSDVMTEGQNSHAPENEPVPAADPIPSAETGSKPSSASGPARNVLDTNRSPSPDIEPPITVIEPQPPKPPKKLYRNVGGRRGNGSPNTPTTVPPTTAAPDSHGVSCVPTPAVNAEAVPPKVPIESLPKKAQKKAARSAKRAMERQENAAPQTLTPPEVVTPPEVSPHIAQFQTAKTVHLAAIASTSSAVGATAPASPVNRQMMSSPRRPPVPRSAPQSPARAGLAARQGAASALDLTAGCHSLQGIEFRPLNELVVSHDVLVSIIGVLAVIGPPNTTTTREHCRRVVIVDPSNADSDNPVAGFSVNLFAKKASDLPDAKPGDVLVLHGVQVQAYQGRTNGVCPSYKAWTWIVFSPETSNIVQSPTSSTAGSFDVPNGLGPSEQKYCIALGDWWRAAAKERQRKLKEGDVTVHNLASQEIQHRTAARIHRLIQDASPNAPPNGFFNCTVEVLFGHENTNGVYSLYVTDFTKNTNLYPIQANWCTPAYEGYACKIEMWNEAAQKAPEMQPHEFYEINNVRMKMSTGGYWECSFSEVRKMRKLDEDELEQEPKLAELLIRKKKWEEEVEQHGGHKFPHRLFQQAELDKHFCCTVEILYKSVKDTGHTILYVTDYTARQDLVPIAATAAWTKDIDSDRIVRVTLFNAQVKTAETLREGDIIAIRNLRLKAFSGDKNVSGTVGGDDRLIHKLDPNTTGNDECIALLGRKKTWENRLQERSEAQERDRASKAAKNKRKSNGRIANTRQEVPPPPVAKKIVHSQADQDTEPPDSPKPQSQTPIRGVATRPLGAEPLSAVIDSDPTQFQSHAVFARVSDFFPIRVEDFVVLQCTNCGRNIPEQYRICTECDDDMEYTHVRPFFRFRFELEDEEGTCVEVVAAEPKWGRIPNLLKDFEPVDFREDPDALQNFKDKLRPILGDLVDRYEDPEDAENGQPSSNTPFCKIVVVATPATETRGRDLCLWSLEPPE